MWISAFFTNGGNPVTGLSPSIRIRDVSNNNLIVTDVSMNEVGDGFYKYDFIFFNIDDDYVIRCDAGITLSGTDRYTFGSSGEYNNDFSSIDATLSGIDIATSAVDSRLPLLPAFVDEYTATLSGIQADLDSPDQYKADTLGLAQAGEYDATLSGIQEDLDNPDQYKANTSGLAPAGEYDTTLSGIQEDLDNPDQYKTTISGLALAGEYDTTLSGIQGDLDNPDQYKADISGLASAGEYTATLSGIQEDLDNPDQYKADVSIFALDIMKLVKQNRQWNMSTENIVAASGIVGRNVAIGKTDYIVIKIKEDSALDWSGPIREEKIYAWYKNMGDSSPYYMGEE
jgi:hypothetical protein